MLSFTWSAFDRGPVARVLDLAIMCQESQGTYALTDELGALVRLIRSSDEAEWLCPVTAVTALLDLAAEHLSAGPDAPLPEEFTAKLGRAAAGTDGPAYLRLLAETIRLVEREAVTDPGGTPGSAWESEVRFRALRGFHDNWLSDGEYPTPREAIRAAIDSEHPFCGEFLAPVAAQAQYALVHVLESHDAQSPMARTMPWATAETLTVLLDTVNGHLRHDHTAS
ncbi:hypothetical protein [Streptomyces sp. LN325]|uniref:hypothetical protein n=1 Tax=Streptomyces sp. LN325 TaxID=3112976 RepID=UPI00371F35FF